MKSLRTVSIVSHSINASTASRNLRSNKDPRVESWCYARHVGAMCNNDVAQADVDGCRDEDGCDCDADQVPGRASTVSRREAVG